MTTDVLDLAGYIQNCFEHEPLHIFELIDMLLTEEPVNDWIHPICHEEPKTPNSLVESHRQSANNDE
jgi:hypothetical protein